MSESNTPLTVHHMEVVDRMARIETKLDMHLDRTEQHEKRIAWIETKVNYFIGIMVTLNGILFLLKDKIMRIVSG